MKRIRFLGLLLKNDMGRAYHAPIEPSKDELEVIERRQAMRVLQPAKPDRVPRDWTLIVAASCIAVCMAAIVVALFLEVIK